MGVVFFWVLFAVAVGVFASNRGRSGFGWFFLSLVISPLLGIVFCAVSKNLGTKANSAEPSSATHKKCTACAEFVLHEAMVCKHCGSALEADYGAAQRQITATKEVEAKESIKLIMGIAFVLALLSAVVMLSR